MGHWICSSPCIHRGEPAGLTDVTCAGSQALLFCPTEVAQKHLMHAVGGPFGFDIGWMNVECSSLLPRYSLGLVCLQILPLLWSQTRRILIIRQYRGFVSPSTFALPKSSLVAPTKRKSDLTCCITQVDLGHTRGILPRYMSNFITPNSCAHLQPTTYPTAQSQQVWYYQ